MGKWISTQPGYKARPGCWQLQNAEFSPQLGQKDRLVLFGGIIHGEWSDCDCLLLGLCMPGEPPMPPLSEFAEDPKINLGMDQGKHPKKQPHPVIPNSHVYRPPLGGSRYGVPSGSKHDISRRDLIVESPWPSPWAFPEAVIRAYRTLSSDQQKAILYYWPAFGPIARNLRQNFDPSRHELDPRPVLAIMLGDPAGPGGDVVRLMNRKWANFLIQCAWQSFAIHGPTIQRGLEKMATVNTEEVKEIEVNNEIRPLEQDKKPQELAREYLEVFLHCQRLWRSNLPLHLHPMPTGHSKFLISQGTGGLNETNRIKAKVLVPRFLDTALNSIKHSDANFVADVDYIVASIHQQLDLFNRTNPYLKSIGIQAKLDSLPYELDWTREALHAAFNETLPQLQLTMGLFSLSLWAGLGHY